MSDVFLCGHGAWYPRGFVELPTFTEVLLYTEVGGLLSVDTAVEVLSEMDPAQRPAPERVISHERCPDLTLSPVDGTAELALRAAVMRGHIQSRGDLALFVRGGDVQLSQVLAGALGALPLGATRIHWIACGAFGLTETRRGPFGANPLYDVAVR